MNATLEELFADVEKAVAEQQEQDQWEEAAHEQFPTIGNQLFDRIEVLLEPLKQRLSGYKPESVDRVWSLTRTDEYLKIHYDSNELTFKLIGKEAKIPGDRYTVQICRFHDQLVSRYSMIPVLGTDNKFGFGVMGHAAIPEQLDDRHIVSALVDEFLKKRV